MRWMAAVMGAGMAMSLTAGAQTSVAPPPAAQVTNPAAGPTPLAAQVAPGSEANM
jgi:hypothetical protein